MKIKSALYLFAVAVLFVGCSNPGIVKLSPDTYMLSRADRAGIFGNTAALKAGVIQDANEFAEKQGKVAIPINVAQTPVYSGHFATVEYQFRVVDRNDPEAKRTSLVPRADVVIEKNEKISANIHKTDDTPKQTDLYTEIMKLDDLRKKGLITDAEFEQQKQRLLAQAK